jgi:hypothetical protein
MGSHAGAWEPGKTYLFTFFASLREIFLFQKSANYFLALMKKGKISN